MTIISFGLPDKGHVRARSPYTATSVRFVPSRNGTEGGGDK